MFLFERVQIHVAVRRTKQHFFVFGCAVGCLVDNPQFCFFVGRRFFSGGRYAVYAESICVLGKRRSNLSQTIKGKVTQADGVDGVVVV